MSEYNVLRLLVVLVKISSKAVIIFQYAYATQTLEMLVASPKSFWTMMLPHKKIKYCEHLDFPYVMNAI